MANSIDWDVTQKQWAFINATEDEVLFGGAAGGGKSHGQLIDAFLYAMKYAGSSQLILRRTYGELDRSLIRKALEMYPKELYTYTGNTHTGRFINGSILDFGYCASENDVYQYQSAEYDVIRFDELTHFTEFQYLYLISRLRGANPFPRQIKCSTNPGSVGHMWVKERFVDPSPPGVPFDSGKGTRIFIPAKVQENRPLMENDPGYIERLQNLPELERRALLEGDWNIFKGIRFTSFRTETHVIDPFEIPKGWRRYRTIDYGLDRLACLWLAVDGDGNLYYYKELCESNLIISDACKKIKEMTDEDIYATMAPPDLWSRGQETGKSRALLFADHGVPLLKVSNDRAAGWSAVDELLKLGKEGRPKMYFFRNCTETIKCLPMLQIDPKKPDDVMTEPHEITHAPDAVRYSAVFFVRPNKEEVEAPFINRWTPDMYEDYRNGSPEEKREMIRMWGRPHR